METFIELILGFQKLGFPPYSLGKLIEWKRSLRDGNRINPADTDAPYSLGKLIEWKLSLYSKGKHPFDSLLVREIN